PPRRADARVLRRPWLGGGASPRTGLRTSTRQPRCHSDTDLEDAAASRARATQCHLWTLGIGATGATAVALGAWHAMRRGLAADDEQEPQAHQSQEGARRRGLGQASRLPPGPRVWHASATWASAAGIPLPASPPQPPPRHPCPQWELKLTGSARGK